MAPIVRTVRGDIPPSALGITYMHEHLIVDSPLVADRFPHIHLPSVAEAIAEVATCRAAGVGTMVDAMPCAAGRDVGRLVAVSDSTGMHIVAATGLHHPRYYEGRPWTQHAAVEDLADLFTADLTEGVDRWDYSGPVVSRTEFRAGIIKVATRGGTLSGPEHRLFEAAAEAHLRTGAAILTHCEDGRGGLEQVAALRALDVQLEKVVLSHTDKHPDARYHAALLESGVNLEYDQALRQKADQPRGTATLLTEMLGAGHVGRLLLGTDGARRSLWRTLGGSPGLDYLVTGYREVLRRRGVDAATLHTLLVENPARVLAFDPAR